jgi:4-hydroxybenzoate polyprenyltransferase
VSAPSDPPPGRLAGAARFLELQNLGLNLPFALAFLFLAARGLPSARVVVLVVVAFVAARTAGHSFNRWADRALDAQNPRTRGRTVAAGRTAPGVALAIAAASGAVVVVAAYFLNPLALALSPVALALVFGYSYTKRVTTFTTAFLGLVEAIVPAAVFIAVTGTLAPPVLFAVAGLLAWGTAFETVHSLGDLESDRALGLFSVPLRIGARRSVALVPVLHALALIALAAFGAALGLRLPYFVALGAMAVLAAIGDARLAREPTATRRLFRLHFVMSGLFLLGAVLAVFVVGGPAW